MSQIPKPPHYTVIRSNNLTVAVGTTSTAPAWMENAYLKAKKYGLINLASFLEKLAERQGYTL